MIVNAMRHVEATGMREGEGNESASRVGAILCR
jgi:hypothetical protein